MNIMFSAADKAEATSLMSRYIEKLQAKGQMGRQTLRDLSKVLRYKADVLDRRYIKCVLFPEFSTGARIPAPHTVPTGTWKIVTEYSYTVPAAAGDGGVAVPQETNVGFVVDLEVGARNQQCLYIYSLERGVFGTYPNSIVNGKGIEIPITPVGGLAVQGGHIAGLDFASMDPTSLYTRYRLVGASFSFIPVTIRNPLGEFNMAQTEDFDLGVKDPANISTGANAFVEYLCSPLNIVQQLLDLRADGPFYNFAGVEDAHLIPAELPDTDTNPLTIEAAFKNAAALIQNTPPALPGSLIAWSPTFNLVSAAVPQSLLSRLWGGTVYRYKDKETFTGSHLSEQARRQLELVNDNANVVQAIMALNFVMQIPVSEGHITDYAAFTGLKATRLTPWLRAIQNTINSPDVFALCQGIIRSIFPTVKVPKEKNRRGLSKVKIQECPYQVVSSLGMGTRMIYLPRSSKALAFRDVEEVMSDQKKDIFWGCTTGLMSGDQFKIIITRHYEGVCATSMAGYLSVERTTPDAKTLETIDRIATLAPDLITVPPHLVEETYKRVKDSLGYLVIGDNPIESKTDGVLRQQLSYDRDGLPVSGN